MNKPPESVMLRQKLAKAVQGSGEVAAVQGECKVSPKGKREQPRQLASQPEVCSVQYFTSWRTPAFLPLVCRE